MNIAQSKGLIDPTAHYYLRELAGNRKNQDTYV